MKSVIFRQMLFRLAPVLFSILMNWTTVRFALGSPRKVHCQPIWQTNCRSFRFLMFHARQPLWKYVMRCEIWYHLYNLKNELQPATLLKLTLLHGCFSRFLNCTNGIKSGNASQISLQCIVKHTSGTRRIYLATYLECLGITSNYS